MASTSASLRFLFVLLLAGGSITRILHAELTDAQKKALFLESQAETSTSKNAAGDDGSESRNHSAHHPPHPSPTSHVSHTKKHPSGSAKSEKTLHHVHAASGASESSQAEAVATHQQQVTSPSTASAVAQEPHSETAVSSTSITGSTHPEEAGALGVSAIASTEKTPPLPPLPPLPHGAAASAPITIEKSGAEQDQGLEPAPAASSSSWNPIGWFFGTKENYTYLSTATRAAIDRAPVRRGRWKYIIVHNSGTREGNARVFDIYHRRVRHMKNGLAYHFVIGDGHGSGDGEIEIGHRWTAQLNGGHVASDYLNDISLGICLVGDFNRDLPTKAQIGALEELIKYLRLRVGKTQGRQSIVYAHKEINPRPTDCPGDRFPYTWLHATFGKPN